MGAGREGRWKGRTPFGPALRYSMCTMEAALQYSTLCVLYKRAHTILLTTSVSTQSIKTLGGLLATRISMSITVNKMRKVPPSYSHGQCFDS